MCSDMPSVGVIQKCAHSSCFISVPMFNHPIASKHLFDLILICIQQQGLTQFNVEKHMGHLSTVSKRHLTTYLRFTSGDILGFKNIETISSKEVQPANGTNAARLRATGSVPGQPVQFHVVCDLCIRISMMTKKAERMRCFGKFETNLWLKGEVVAVC